MADARAVANRCAALGADPTSIVISSAIASPPLGARHNWVRLRPRQNDGPSWLWQSEKASITRTFLGMNSARPRGVGWRAVEANQLEAWCALARPRVPCD
jgi:hypothetical protein